MEMTPKKGAEMYRYSFRVDGVWGFEIADVIAETIAEAEAECWKRSRRDTRSVTLLGSFDLSPQVCLAW